MQIKLSILLVLVLACGPSEEEIQARVDKAVSDALETTTSTAPKKEEVSNTVIVKFDGYMEEGRWKDGSILFVLEQDALENAKELGCPYDIEAKPTIYKVKNHEYTGRLVYESSCKQPNYDEFNAFFREIMRTACQHNLSENFVLDYYDEFTDKDMPDTYYEIKNALEKEFSGMIDLCKREKTEQEIIKMLYGNISKQETDTLLSENILSEFESNIDVEEYELANCRQISDAYSECTKYTLNGQPVSVIYCVNGFCKEEY